MKFLAVSLEPDQKIVKKSATAMDIQWQVASTKMAVLDPFGVKRAPSTVWIDDTGKIVAAASGDRSLRFLEARTNELVK